MTTTNGKLIDHLPTRIARNANGGSALIPGNPGNSGGKKGRSGRRPDWLKREMARGRELAVTQIIQQLEAGELDTDQMLRLVKEWAPPEDSQSGVTVTVHANGSVTISSPSAA